MKFRTRFPEDLFPPKNLSQYNERVVLGEHIAKHKKVQIIGLAFQCEEVIETNISRCVALGEYFNDYNICILENGSTDETAQKIVNYSKDNNKVRHLIETRHKPDFEPLDTARFQYLAGLRNTVLDHVMSTSFDFDLLVVYDFDIKGGFSYDGVMSSIAYQKGGVCSNGIIYQDMPTGELVRKHYDYITIRFNDLRENWDFQYSELSYNRGDKLQKLFAGFGGLALYKRECIQNNRYDSMYGCEHVAFSQNIDMYLNPDQIVLYNETNYTK